MPLPVAPYESKRRTPTTAANLLIAGELLARYAAESGAVTAAEADALMARVRAWLLAPRHAGAGAVRCVPATHRLLLRGCRIKASAHRAVARGDRGCLHGVEAG